MLDGIALKHGDKKAVYQKLQKSTVERKTIWQCESSISFVIRANVAVGQLASPRRAEPRHATPRACALLGVNE